MDVQTGMVSVVIPYYNRRNLIVDCLKSILAQTYSNLEVIIVDDGSNDHAEEVLAPYLGERVRYYRYEPNQGACHARNVGVSMARGEYIAFQDSDDIWHPEKLEKELEYLLAGGWDMVFCGMNRKDIQNKRVLYYPADGFDEQKSTFAQLLYANRISTQTILEKREMAQRLHFDESFRRFQDWDYALQAAMAGVKMGYLPIALVDSEIQADSISAKVRNGEAQEHLYQKYKVEYDSAPKAYARLMAGMSRECSDREKALNCLRKSLKSHFNPKLFIKYVLMKSRML